MPRTWLGTETVARLLGLRIEPPEDAGGARAPALPTRNACGGRVFDRARSGSPGLRAEAARDALESFSFPQLSAWQQNVLRRALRLVGSPYVWAGTSERPQQLFGRVLPGGFDCSGFVWRVYKLEPFAAAPGLAATLRGRTTYDMSSEAPRSTRISRSNLQPGDVAFFGTNGVRSKPTEVGHMGIYVGNGWMVHSSDRGTTLTPLTGWYETRFAWGRRPLAEAGLA